MSYEKPIFINYDYLRNDSMHIPYKTLEYSLPLVGEAIQREIEDEMFYDYLISIAPGEEERNIIASIRNDERKHNISFKEIYDFYGGLTLAKPAKVSFKKPSSYVEGLKEARLGELTAVEKYRDLRAGLPNQFFRDMVFEIITDELKHAHNYDYLLYLNLEKQLSKKDINLRAITTDSKQKHFSENDAYLIAKVLGVDFNKEHFDVEQFRMGLDVELEHGKVNPLTNVTDDDSIRTGKIVLAHLKEFPDYYTRLAKMEKEAKEYWSSMPD